MSKTLIRGIYGFLFSAVAICAIADEQCSTLEPDICDPHVTDQTNWGCNGGNVCCLTKDIIYHCPPGETQYYATFRWRLQGAGLCDYTHGDPECVTIDP